MHRTATTSTLAALAGTAVLIIPSGAVAADTQLGNASAGDLSCSTGPYTFFQTASPGGSYSASTKGVITSWRIQGGPGAASVRSFKLGRFVGGQLVVAATGAPTPIPSGQLTAQNVRIPAQAGDFLGFSVAAGANGDSCAGSADASYGYSYFTGDLAPGPAGAAATPGTGVKFNVAATLEPDADGDGYGDTTQDACPSQGDTQGACKDKTAPQTTITKAKAAKLKGQAKKARVTVSFKADEAATFGCSVDGSAYKKCSSPLVRRLGAGKHTVKVRATDAAGNTDPTPASRTVRVKRAR